MAFDWKTAIKPVAKGGADNKLTPAQKLAANMDSALIAYKAGNKDVKRPTIKLEGAEVHFSIRYANKALELAPGISTASVPTAKFEQVFAAIRESVLAGDFDAALKPLAEATAARGARLAGKPRAAKAK